MNAVRLSCCALLLAAVPWALAQESQPASDLTEIGAVGHGTTPVEIIDTRLVEPQIQAEFPWDGPVQLVKNQLPPHKRAKVRWQQEANDLPVGELTSARRGYAGMLFPGIQQTAWSPPDPTLAVGVDHVVSTVNMALAFYTKDGTLTFSQNLDSTGNPGFFETVGGGDFTFDPKCFYDHYEDRFVILALETYGTTESWISIAVSDDGDPNGVWYKYRTNSVIQIGSSTYWVDYPGLGFDHRGYYVTGNLFKLSGGGSGWGGVLFRIFDKTPLLGGNPAAWSDLRDGYAGSVQAAQCHGTAQAPFFVDDAGNTSIRIHAIQNPLTNPVKVTATVTVPYFDYPWDSAPNLGGDEIDVLDGRIINVHWRDGNLYTGHGVFAGGRAVSRWYHIDTGNWPTSGSPTLVQSGDVAGGTGVYTWFPAIFQNAAGEVGLVTAMSSATTYASVQITGRQPGDPLGTMGALTEVAIGSSGYNGYRWGDYFDICVDPTNDSTFWAIGEYANGSGNWGTWITSFLVSPIKGDVNCDGAVNGFDIDAFVLALDDPTTYEASFPLCDIRTADVNDDGSVNGFDIDAFVALLGG
ncbi:MAG: dockerin type I repeat-containing protein [Planctomycetes bacterium]|nr:dockerin type I repeat-containing protein [Planctomycetota bacterium]